MSETVTAVGLITDQTDLVVVQSGKIKGARNILNAVLQARAIAVRAGMNQALGEHLPTVALKTGAMRRAFANSINNEIATLVQDKKMTVSFARIVRRAAGRTPYIKYHVDGRPYHKGQMFYVNPTTGETHPINSKQFMKDAHKFATEILNKQLKQRGLEISSG